MGKVCQAFAIYAKLLRGAASTACGEKPMFHRIDGTVRGN